MIVGVFNTNREATIRLIVHDTNGQERAINAIIDTGFTGFLTLPTTLITTLGLTWRGRVPAVLGDGSLQQFDVYAATVIWDGQPRVVEVDAADTDPLVGVGLLYGHEVRIQVIDGGTVTIESLP